MQNVNEAPTYIHQFDKDEQIISTQDLSVFYGGSVQKLFNASLQFKKNYHSLNWRIWFRKVYFFTLS